MSAWLRWNLDPAVRYTIKCQTYLWLLWSWLQFPLQSRPRSYWPVARRGISDCCRLLTCTENWRCLCKSWAADQTNFYRQRSTNYDSNESSWPWLSGRQSAVTKANYVACIWMQWIIRHNVRSWKLLFIVDNLILRPSSLKRQRFNPMHCIPFSSMAVRIWRSV